MEVHDASGADPRSAADALVGLVGIGTEREQRDQGVPRGPGGPPHSVSSAPQFPATAVVLGVLFLAGLLVAADEWPQFRGNPALTGVASGTVPSTLKLLWTYEAGEPIESSAAI